MSLPDPYLLFVVPCVLIELKTENTLFREGMAPGRGGAGRGPQPSTPVSDSPISLIRPRSRWTKNPTSSAVIRSRSFRSAPAEGKPFVTTRKWPVTASQVVKGTSAGDSEKVEKAEEPGNAVLRASKERGNHSIKTKWSSSK